MADVYTKFRNLDSNKDWCFGNNLQDYADKNTSVMLNIKTRLLSFKYDCFFALEQGIDWISLLGQRGSFIEDTIEINVRAIILQSIYVSEIIDLKTNINRERRTIYLEYTVNTVFGETMSDSIEIGGNIWLMQ